MFSRRSLFARLSAVALAPLAKLIPVDETPPVIAFDTVPYSAGCGIVLDDLVITRSLADDVTILIPERKA